MICAFTRRGVECLVYLLAAYGTALCLDEGSFQAGAARVDITPPDGSALRLSGYDARQEGFKGIHDHLYVRALVMSDGTNKAAIITYDLIGTSNAMWEKVSQRISRDFGITRENVLMVGTHTHGAPAVGVYADEPREKQAAYIQQVEAGIVEAVRWANEDLQPARVGYGQGRCNVNMSRTGFRAPGGNFLGLDPDGPSDKTLAVVKFASASGKTLALFANYAVHGTGMGQENYLITADIPGATSRFVELYYTDAAVVLWTSGSAGDQSPINRWEARDFRGVETIAMLLGREILRVAESLTTWPQARIRGLQSVVFCPGRKLLGGQLDRKDLNYQFADAEPIQIRLSLLTFGHIALAGVSGEVYTAKGERLKKESPLSATVVVTHCNGSSGYIPSEEGFKRTSYEVQVSHLKPGCAEEAIVSCLLDMFGKL